MPTSPGQTRDLLIIYTKFTRGYKGSLKNSLREIIPKNGFKSSIYREQKRPKQQQVGSRTLPRFKGLRLRFNMHTENTEFQKYKIEVQVLNNTAIASG